MNKKVEQILEDLYLIDNSLREYQTELEEIVEKLLAAKPEVEINEQFKQDLRRQILARIEQIKGQEPAKSIKSMFKFNKLSYGIYGAVLSLIVVVVGAYFINQQGILVGSPKLGLGDKFAVNSLPDGAFGSLTAEETTSSELGTGGSGRAQSEATGIGGGGGMPGVGPELIKYNYTYNGDDLVLDQDKVEVLRRIKGKASSGIANLIKNINFGMVDLSNFSNADLETASFVQDKELGYAVYVNFREGSISINSHWQAWKDILGICYEQGCVRPEPLDISDIPSEERLIEIADRFIKEYNIKMDNYGQPETRRNWLIAQFERSDMYSMDTVQLTYPLIINDRNVYDQWGNMIGLNLTINLRVMKVVSLYDLHTLNYEGSLYEAETDAAKILEVTEKGGTNQAVFGRNASKTIEAEIGNPSAIYMKTYKHEAGYSEELLVPALLFPVSKTVEKGVYYKENVVVPLVKELLEQGNNGPVMRVQ